MKNQCVENLATWKDLAEKRKKEKEEAERRRAEEANTEDEVT